MEFEWDISKDIKNIEKHEVSFEDAVDCFLDPDGFSLQDEQHSKDEERFFWVGKNTLGRVLTTWYTRRGLKIRIIGCAEFRKMRSLYNERTKKNKNE